MQYKHDAAEIKCRKINIWWLTSDGNMTLSLKVDDWTFSHGPVLIKLLIKLDTSESQYMFEIELAPKYCDSIESGDKHFIHALIAHETE